MRNQPLANTDWVRILNLLAVGDASNMAFVRYYSALECEVPGHEQLPGIRADVFRRLVNRGVWV